MDHDEYVAARRGRLLEHAAELGCPEKVAADQVDWVLEEQRRLIERSEDPDPGVREALARHIAGVREPRGPALTYAAIAVVLVLVATAAVLWRPREPPPVPSLFGYDVATATQVLQDVGYQVRTVQAEACEPRNLVLGSDPVPGTSPGRGATITLRAAVPANPLCLATYGFRSDAWAFIGFVRGGEAPDFAPLVKVYFDGASLALLSARAATDRRSWTEPLVLVEEAATRVSPTRSAMPSLTVDSLVPPSNLCGVPVPTPYGGRLALRLQIDPSPDGSDQLCPFTVDLYRDIGSRIEAVSIFSGVTQSTQSTQGTQGTRPRRAPARPPRPGRTSGSTPARTHPVGAPDDPPWLVGHLAALGADFVIIEPTELPQTANEVAARRLRASGSS